MMEELGGHEWLAWWRMEISGVVVSNVFQVEVECYKNRSDTRRIRHRLLIGYT